MRNVSNTSWRGKLKLDEPQGLLAYFYSKVSDELRAYAFRFVGQGLRHTGEEILPDILERLKALLKNWVDVATPLFSGI